MEQDPVNQIDPETGYHVKYSVTLSRKKAMMDPCVDTPVSSPVYETRYTNNYSKLEWVWRDGRHVRVFDDDDEEVYYLIYAQ